MAKKGEFGLIDFINAHFHAPAGMVGIGDDCAIVPGPDEDTLVSTDMLLEGIHFLRKHSTPEDIGWKSAAVNLSDIAAMGGIPVATFLSIALPKDAQGEWAQRFIKGYAEISGQFGVPLLGGDTTSSLRDIAINVGIKGRCDHGKALGRGGAKVGHTIFVTGPLGDSGAGLKAILTGVERTPAVEELIRRHLRPMPRVAEGQKLLATGMVGAMMDLSDGLASDLGHILRASGVGAIIELNALPLSPEIVEVCRKHRWRARTLAASAGEDYELLLTGPAELAQAVDIPLYPIGTITEAHGIEWLRGGKPTKFKAQGFTHF